VARGRSIAQGDLTVGVLDAILANKRSELDALGRLRLPTPPARRAVDLRRGAGESLRLVAEIKLRSPSAGALSNRLPVSERAGVYERAGAAMISVLCDRHYFDGDYGHLASARSETSIPILCKEFVIDERQLDAARSFGADAILLIARCLDDTELPRLMTEAHARDLEPLVEVHTEQEARRALDAGATFVGVNARDLDTLEMNVPAARRLLDTLPAGVVRVHLSGIATPADVHAVAVGTVDAALLGEALMREDDPEPLLRSLVEAARNDS
jgi:indole-3-glycerol phosphate synthase